MRIYSFIQVFVFLVAFGVYFYVIEPKFTENVLNRYLIMGVIYFTLIYVSKRLDGRFKILDKRIDGQLSAWILFVVIFMLLIVV